ncbi:MAG: lysoplasmalogenase [Treponema sp.]|nr:lysoplasmalogenase [Treponema sp.]
MTIVLSILMYIGVFVLDYSCICTMNPQIALVGKTLASLSFVLLAVVILFNKDCKKLKYKKLIFTGLCFGCIGDICLNVNFISGTETAFFLIGLLAFAIGHIFYALAFIDRSPIKILTFVPVLLTLSAFVTITREFSSSFDMGSLFIPILIYGAMVSFMAAKSLGLFIYKEKSKKTVWLTVLGAWMFYISDFILLFLFFVPAFSSRTPGYNRTAFIILTLGNSIIYYTGQLLMAFSLKGDLE